MLIRFRSTTVHRGHNCGRQCAYKNMTPYDEFEKLFVAFLFNISSRVNSEPESNLVLVLAKTCMRTLSNDFSLIDIFKFLTLTWLLKIMGDTLNFGFKPLKPFFFFQAKIERRSYSWDVTCLLFACEGLISKRYNYF